MTTVDIVRAIVAGLSYEIPVNSIDDLGGGLYQINVCNTYHQSAVKALIELDGKKYKITEVINNQSIKIQAQFTPASAPGITVFPLAAPKFFHGTAIDVNNEQVRVKDANQKLPMVYLYEEFRETYNDDPGNAIDRIADLTLYLMDQADYKNWITDDHYDNVVGAMKNLAIELINAFRNSVLIGKFDSTHTETIKVNFGVFTVNGNEQQFLDSYMSGIEMRLSLPIEKQMACDAGEVCNC